jgi:ethanolamine utilization protein EutQ (cupin superfamily)
MGSVFLKADCVDVNISNATYSKHAVSVIMEVKLLTTSGGKTVILKAGNIISIPKK